MKKSRTKIIVAIVVIGLIILSFWMPMPYAKAIDQVLLNLKCGDSVDMSREQYLYTRIVHQIDSGINFGTKGYSIHSISSHPEKYKMTNEETKSGKYHFEATFITKESELPVIWMKKVCE
jgi:hypothetical protein